MNAGTGSLAALASELVDLRLPLRVDPGTVVLIFRNGAPIRVVQPGRVHRRLRGLPMLGQLKAMTLSTADIPAEVTVPGVVLRGTYPLESVTLSFTVCLDRDREYAGLLAYAARKGLNFPALLEQELRAEVDVRVRDALVRSTAEQVYRDRAGLDPAGFAATGPLLDGLFAISKVVFGTPVFDPGFLAARQAEIDAEVEATRKRLELEQSQLDRLVEQARDQLQLDRAQRRGMTFAEFENPELKQQELQHRHELLMGLLDKLDEVRRGGGGDAVNTIMTMIAAQLDGSAGGPSQPPPMRVASADWLDAGVPDALGLEHLRRDSYLTEIWESATIPVAPVALGIAGDALLAVCREDVDERIEAMIGHVFREHTGVREVIVISRATTVEHVVLEYLRVRVPEHGAAVTGAQLDPAPGGLKLRLLGGTGARLSPLTRAVNDPDGRVLDPLTTILPGAVVDVRISDGA